MELAKVLSQLRQELADLDAAIASLERFQEGPKRGRPPKERTRPGSAAGQAPALPAEVGGRNRGTA
jgi:hypothetical protein